METIAFIRLHQFDVEQQTIMNRIADHCDGLFFLIHDLVDPKMLTIAENHPKCIEIRHWTKKFGNLVQLQHNLEWASEIKPKYVIEFDEDELPPDKFNEEFQYFKQTNFQHMFFWGLWSYNNINNIAIFPMRRYFPHHKVYKWSKSLSKAKRSGFCSFVGRNAHHKVSYISKYPLRHLAFLTNTLRERRLKFGNSKGHQYSREISWFMQPDIHTIQYDPNKTVEDWMKIYYETFNNNLQ